MAKNVTRLRVEAQGKILAAIANLAATVQRSGSIPLALAIIEQGDSIANRWGAGKLPTLPPEGAS